MCSVFFRLFLYSKYDKLKEYIFIFKEKNWNYDFKFILI